MFQIDGFVYLFTETKLLNRLINQYVINTARDKYSLINDIKCVTDHKLRSFWSLIDSLSRICRYLPSINFEFIYRRNLIYIRIYIAHGHAMSGKRRSLESFHASHVDKWLLGFSSVECQISRWIVRNIVSSKYLDAYLT